MSDEGWDTIPDTTPSREPVSARGRRTRAKLLESGRQALAERGHNNTRVDDVVSRAGTSHGTFYLYFENVEDLLAAVVEECDAESADLLASLARTSPDNRAATAAVLTRFTELRTRYGEIASPWLQPVGRADSRVVTLAGTLGIDDDRAVATLAVIDRVLPQMDQEHDGARRVAALIETLRQAPTPSEPVPAPPAHDGGTGS